MLKGASFKRLSMVMREEDEVGYLVIIVLNVREPSSSFMFLGVSTHVFDDGR